MILIIEAGEADGVPLASATRATLEQATNSDLDDAALSATFVFYIEGEYFKCLKAPERSGINVGQIHPLGLFTGLLGTRIKWALQWERSTTSDDQMENAPQA